MASSVSSIRVPPPGAAIEQKLQRLANLGGTWQGTGFNLIARPNFVGNTPLYLQLNQTVETLVVTPIGSPIPNRGFGMEDIELNGLTYLQKISDAPTGGAMHIEPGIWVTQPTTTYPEQAPPANAQIIARMASIPHGTTVLAQGIAADGDTEPPTLQIPGGPPYRGSAFRSFNSTPFGIKSGALSPLNAAGSSEALTAPALTPPKTPFPEYDLANSGGAVARSPQGTSDPPLPNDINGVPMQEVINDPIKLLQATLNQQLAQGCTFQTIVLNVATQKQIAFFNQPNAPTGPSTTIDVTDGFGTVGNILFLDGVDPPTGVGPNAQTSLVYSTFWLETVTPTTGPPFKQLQYAQMTVLNFGILNAPGAPILGWPHVSVATLRQPFS